MRLLVHSPSASSESLVQGFGRLKDASGILFMHDCGMSLCVCLHFWQAQKTYPCIACADDPANHKILMVLEYVEGGSLFAGTRIAPKKRLTELAARKYFRDVLQASQGLQT